MSYTQCTLKKGKNTFTQCWLETSKVKLGRFVKLIELGDEFWQITSTGKTQKENPEIKFRTWNNNI